MQKKNISFIDYDFLPVNKSVGWLNDRDMFDEFECIIQWRNVEEIMAGFEGEPDLVDYVFKDKIEPADIKKGHLKNIWLLTAIMCISEKEKLIKRLIKT